VRKCLQRMQGILAPSNSFIVGEIGNAAHRRFHVRDIMKSKQAHRGYRIPGEISLCGNCLRNFGLYIGWFF